MSGERLQSTTDPYLTHFRLFRRVQQRNRFITTDQDTGLTLVESFVLLEVDTEPQCNAQHLAVLLGINKGTASRVLAKLQSDGFVVAEIGGSYQQIIFRLLIKDAISK